MNRFIFATMKRIFSILAVVAVLAFAGGILSEAVAAGTIKESGNLVTKSFPMSPFKGVKVSGIFGIEFIQTDTEGDYRIEVTSSDNIVEHIVPVINEEGILEITFDTKVKFRLKKINVKVYGHVLNNVRMSGTGDFKCLGNINSDDLTVNVSGTGDIEIASLNAKKAELNISGAGSIMANEITSDNLSMKLSGAGGIQLNNFKGGDIKARVSGAGGIKIKGKASDGDFIVSGAGSIDITHLKLDNCTTSMSGAGRVKR